MKSVRLNKMFILCLLPVFFFALSCGLAQATTLTIATFADPSTNSGNPLFTIDLATDIIAGGWDDGKTGLKLNIPYSGNSFQDAFFTMTDVSYTGGLSGGDTGGGTIKFFADNQDTSTTPLIEINFGKGHLTPFGFGGSDLFFVGSGDNVIISGSEIGGATLTDETFSFSFANQVPLNGDTNNGYTATASFTSSAVPEPNAIVLLGMGGLGLLAYTWRRRER